MTQLWAWEYKGKTEYGWKHWERTQVSLYVAQDSSVSPIRNISKVTNLREVKVVDEDAVVFDKKVIDHWKNLFSEKEWNQLLDSVKLEIDPTPPVTKTYLTTDQFIKVYKSLSNEKRRLLSATRSAVWSATLDTDLAVLAKDKITTEQFEILTSPWTSCGLSLYAEDWEQVLNPKVVEPKNFGAIVEAQVMINQVYPAWIPPHPKPPVETNYSKPVRWLRNPVTGLWSSEPCDHLRISYTRKWGELHNPTIISEGVEG